MTSTQPFDYSRLSRRMLIRLMPLLLMAILVVLGFSYTLVRGLITEEYNTQRDALIENTAQSLRLIDHGYGLLDRHLEEEMSAVIEAFRRIFEATPTTKGSGPIDLAAIDLESIKAGLGGAYDLMVIDEQTTIIASTIPEGLHFNFKTFSPDLGHRINQVRLGDTVFHERIRTNVGNGLLSKFTYLPTSDHKYLLEIAYAIPGYQQPLEALDPVRLLETIGSQYSHVVDIQIFDIYGYQYTHGDNRYEPTEESIALVKRAIESLSYQESLSQNRSRYVKFLPELDPGPLSDHSRVLAITFDDTHLVSLKNTLIWIMVTAGLVAMVITVTILIFEIRQITKPIQALTSAAKAVSDGDYKVELPLQGTDEITYLTDVFNHMVKTIDEHYTDISSQFKTMLYSMGDGVVVVDTDGNVRLMNPSAENILGKSSKDCLGFPVKSILEIDEEAMMNTRQTAHSEYTYKKNDRITLTLAYTQALLPHGGFIFVLRDMTEHRARLSQIRYLSENDQLTGLLNRRAYERHRHSFTQDSLGVILIDLNGLKLVNDAYGHTAGDRLLKGMAMVLHQVSSQDERLYRIGGDEFVVVLPNTTADALDAYCNQLYTAFATFSAPPLVLSASIGSAIRTDKTFSFEMLFDLAEERMYRNKLSESAASHIAIIDHIAHTLFHLDPDLEAHTQRVAKSAVHLGRSLSLSKDRIEHLERAALMHDIGKSALKISDPSHGDRHPEVGYQILKSVTQYAFSAEIVLAHHEFYDGSGYPRGLKGDQIPLESQILAFCNWLDDKRTQDKMQTTDLLALIQAQLGRLFSPLYGDVFLWHAENFTHNS